MFYYYGAKASKSHLYPEPVHRTVVEPFAGAAGYAVHHLVAGTADRAVLVEKDPRVVELWNRLLSMTPDEVMALPVPGAGTVTTDWFNMTTATSNGTAACRKMTVSARMPKLVQSQKVRVAARLPHLVGRVEVVEGSFLDAPDVEATWFVDPPYQPHPDKGTSARTGSPQGMGYAKGCRSSDLDFGELAEWCRSRRGQVVVAEQVGADWLPFAPLFATHDSLNKRKFEAVWTNDAEG